MRDIKAKYVEWSISAPACSFDASITAAFDELIVFRQINRRKQRSLPDRGLNKDILFV